MFSLLLAAVVAASSCAALPEAGQVAAPGPAQTATPVPNADRTLRCPDGYTLNALARPPKCTRPGVKAVDGSPRAACYAVLALGPFADLPVRNRPTRSCSHAKITTIIRLTGLNAGLADAELSVSPPAGIAATSLTAISDDVPVDENPVLQSCFAHQCRLVKLEIAAAAAPQVTLKLAFPDQPPATATLKLPEYCPH